MAWLNEKQDDKKRKLTKTPSANIVHQYGEHQNAYNVQHYEYSPECFITPSLQITHYQQQLSHHDNHNKVSLKKINLVEH